MRSPSRAAAYRPVSFCATRTHLHRSDRANVHRAAALRQRGWSVVLLCNGFWPAPGRLCSAWPLHLTSAASTPASVTPHADAPAPLGSRERASRGCPHRRCGRLPPNSCNGYGLRHPLCPTRPLRHTSATSAPASMFCMRLRLGSRTDLPALLDSPPTPRSERSAIFCPHIAEPQAPAAKRASARPWRRTRSCMALGHAPIDQNCPQSRTRLTPCFRRIWGAANAAGASEAGGWKRDQESASLSCNLRAMVRSEIGTRLRVCYS